MKGSSLNAIIWFSILAVCFANSTTAEPPCGDWEPYKDERCFKVLESAGLQTFENAEKTCHQSGAGLVVIKYPEEQAFLINFLINKSKAVDNAWIGAKFNGNKITWDDSSELGYTNWAAGHPKNLANTCVQIHADPDSLGKWSDETCLKKNLVVCQKRPILGIEHLQEILLQVKQSLIDTQKEFASTKQSLANTENELAATKLSLVHTEKDLTTTKQSLVDTQKDLATTKQSLHDGMESSKKALASSKEEAQRHLNQVRENALPVGFIYVQLPSQSAPGNIFPGKWTEISSSYAGVFFRVNGGNSASFGQVQGDNSPRLERVNHHRGNDRADTGGITPGTWSHGIFTGSYSGSDHYSCTFYVSSGEVRPVNMAIRVWKRSG